LKKAEKKVTKTRNQLVIVEGLTGLGKSTLAHFIARLFQYNGIEACWIHEGEVPHPVGTEIEQDIKAYMDRSLEKWKKLATQILEVGVVTVIEASFFNNLIETLFTHCLDNVAILDYGMKLQDAIMPARPCLIYLTHPDTSTALAKNFHNRGPRFQDFVIEYVSNEPISKERRWNDYDGVLEFWSEFVSITDALYRVLEIDKLSIDVSAGEWERYNQQVSDFLTLPLFIDPKINPDKAEKFVGDYQFREDGEIYKIEYKNGVLATNIFMNVETKLIPENERAFLTDKWHFKLIFDIDGNGEVTSFIIGGQDIDYLKAVGLSATKRI
jgi:hypothetical protein